MGQKYFFTLSHLIFTTYLKCSISNISSFIERKTELNNFLNIRYML